jgi:hypothetical protein
MNPFFGILLNIVEPVWQTDKSKAPNAGFNVTVVISAFAQATRQGLQL